MIITSRFDLGGVQHAQSLHGFVNCILIIGNEDVSRTSFVNAPLLDMTTRLLDMTSILPHMPTISPQIFNLNGVGLGNDLDIICTLFFNNQ